MEFLFVIVLALVGLAILYFVVQYAVLSALASHYKTVRWYEATGEWLYGTGGERKAPAELPSARSPQP